jgi:hypothetical protein
MQTTAMRAKQGRPMGRPRTTKPCVAPRNSRRSAVIVRADKVRLYEWAPGSLGLYFMQGQ